MRLLRGLSCAILRPACEKIAKHVVCAAYEMHVAWQACAELDIQADALAAAAAAVSKDVEAVRVALQDMTRVNSEKEYSLRCTTLDQAMLSIA